MEYSWFKVRVYLTKKCCFTQAKESSLADYLLIPPEINDFMPIPMALVRGKTQKAPSKFELGSMIPFFL